MVQREPQGTGAPAAPHLQVGMLPASAECGNVFRRNIFDGIFSMFNDDDTKLAARSSVLPVLCFSNPIVR